LHSKKTEWKDQVEVISCDMRDWDAPEKADIIVSELLGSFADNELSPECLDGAQRFLKDSGISIPCDSTSYLAPICSPHVWMELIRSCHSKLDSKSIKVDITGLETPYVAKLFKFCPLSTAKPVFHFVHPNRETPIDNNRYTRMKFHCPQAGQLHGFIGYFESTLYKDISISIYPPTFSRGMFSWFPIYFPIRTPVDIAADTTLQVEMWRVSDSKHTWYEWSVSEPVSMPIHNSNGRSYRIGL
jgi:type II protein arginine methyltransferase